jgi:hypothetical protein
VHLLIAGIPGTGKSTFTRWLINHHHYVRCPFGEEPGPTFWADINEARATRPNVVIDWGFPVSCLPAVRTLIASGVKPWWFDGDRDAALQSFLARPDHPATRADWDRQITAIQQHWNEIKVVFRGGFCGLSAMSERALLGSVTGNRSLECPDSRAISLALRPGTLLGR